MLKTIKRVCTVITLVAFTSTLAGCASTGHRSYSSTTTQQENRYAHKQASNHSVSNAKVNAPNAEENSQQDSAMMLGLSTGMVIGAAGFIGLLLLQLSYIFI